MSLEYLNGIGASRKRSGGGSRGGAARKRAATQGGKMKGQLRRVVKAAPKNPIAAARMAKQLMKKHSPLNAIRIKKALKQSRQRAVFEETGEPMFVESEQLEPQDAPQEIQDAADEMEAEGIEEVDAQEFDGPGTPDSEEGGADMGVIYPDDMTAISGKKAREKRKLKSEKKTAKTDKKKASAELKRAKGQAKLEKAKAGGGKFKESFDKALDTAGKFLDKKKGGEDDEKAPEPSFFEKNKMLIIGGGAALLIGGFLLMRKK